MTRYEFLFKKLSALFLFPKLLEQHNKRLVLYITIMRYGDCQGIYMNL